MNPERLQAFKKIKEVGLDARGTIVHNQIVTKLEQGECDLHVQIMMERFEDAFAIYLAGKHPSLRIVVVRDCANSVNDDLKNRINVFVTRMRYFPFYETLSDEDERILCGFEKELEKIGQVKVYPAPKCGLTKAKKKSMVISAVKMLGGAVGGALIWLRFRDRT